MAENLPQKTRIDVNKSDKEIDWNVFRRSCIAQCTAEEIAASFEMSADTLSRRCMEEKGKTFAELKRIFAPEGLGSLRSKMYQKAMDDNAKGQVKMMIWLSKNYLGMADKIEDDRYKDLEPLVIETSQTTINLTLQKKKEDEE
jgi:hypothetical protein